MKEKPVKTKKIINKHSFFNPYYKYSPLYDIEKHFELIDRQEQFNGLSQLWQVPIIEGILLIGIEQKRWKNRRHFFNCLRDSGCRVTYQSYYKFLSGQFRYLNSEIITIALFLSATDIVTAYQIGFEQAQEILKRYK